MIHKEAEKRAVAADEAEEKGFVVMATILRDQKVSEEVGNRAVQMYRDAANSLEGYSKHSKDVFDKFTDGNKYSDSTFSIAFRMNGHKPCMVITFESMYDSDFSTYGEDATPFVHMAMVAASKAFGTDNINSSDELDCISSGCDTCGHGGSWEQKIYVYDFKL